MSYSRKPWLARAIQDDVQARYGVRLEPEPVVVPSA